MRKINIIPYLIQKFDASFRNNNYRLNCPFCDDEKERMGVDPFKGVTHCFHCNYSASILKFAMDVEGATYGQIFQILSKYASKTTKEIKRIEPKGSRFNMNRVGYVPLLKIKSNSPTVRLATSYLKARGIGREDIKLWKIGLSKLDIYVGRIVIPFFENKKMVYFITRKYMGGGPKYKNPPKELFGVGKSELVYNIDNAKDYKEVIVCEGAFDVWAVGKNAVAIMGKDISDIQLKKILKTGCKKIGILLDSEAIIDAYKMASIFNEYIPTYIYKLKEGDPSSSGLPLSEIPKSKYRLKDHLEIKIRTT